MTKYLPLLSVFILFSCGSSSTDESKKEDADKKDTTETISDENNNETEEAEEMAEEDKVVVANPENTSIEAYEKKGGMSFCDCVKKTAELDEEMMADETTDERFEEIMAEKDKLMNGDCAVLKVGGQSSPDEREARLRKVKACLSN